MTVRFPELIEERAVAGPDALELIEPSRGRLDQTLASTRLLLAQPGVLAQAQHPDDPRQGQSLAASVRTMTVRVTMTSASRAGNGTPPGGVSGSTRTAASETTPRMRVHDRRNEQASPSRR